MTLSNIFRRALLIHFIATGSTSNSTEITNCTLPTHPRFVPSPDFRGTLDILWSSLFTIIACTWTIQHLNVPAQRNSYKPGWWGTFEWHLKSFYTSVKWMVITTIAPEIMIGMACYDYLSAKRNLRDMQEFAAEDDAPWTLTHSYYANIGGFVIHSALPETSHTKIYESSKDYRGTTRGRGRSIPKHSKKAHRNSLPSMIVGNNGEISYHNPYHLTGRQIWQLRDNGHLPSLPHISEAELEDRSKSDSFVQAIALFQIIWAVVQVILRTARKLTISQLELAVIAFAACAIVIYGLRWSKPKSVGATTTIIQYSGPIPQKVLQLIKGRHTYMGYLLLADGSLKIRHGSPIRNDATENYVDDDAGFWVYPTMILGAILFGGIHVAAWNFPFPTPIELWVWRCASVWTAICGPLLILLGLLLEHFEKFETGRVFTLQILTFLYIIARLALLVEIFRTLPFLPPNAYVSTWASDIPHVG